MNRRILPSQSTSADVTLALYARLAEDCYTQWATIARKPFLDADEGVRSGHPPAPAFTVAVIVLIALTLPLAMPGTTLADASPQASCIGIESSSISPPGSSTEELGGRAQLAHELKGLGGPPGAIVSFIAHIHAGSHEDCDNAIE